MSQYGFYFDMTKCIGCRTCQIACKDKNRLEVGSLFRNVKTYETGTFPNPSIYHLSTTCNHCKNPKCAEGCPTGALHKVEQNGIVDYEPDMCIGCKYCIWNCPYGVPQYVEDEGIINKCDACKDLVAKGQNPACVDACLMRCIEFGELDDLKKKYGKDAVSELPILPSASVTNPSVLIKPRKAAYSKVYVEREV
ncbi:anaerobic dimethyl sulfoxide reductase chain B [Clostridium pasteurianum DSM 525 = ATCC 6013]|uniref:Anaerobic dimethyl sulfoxide reductase chain B n=1 Tax=Clostridium pasteurianum DSM 525 = ATCC 6013 TaxID=1262449 RepID=A0A0H3JBC3_CLOPA|nr:DMSO/selenate family reductase complex B subunit [Clostridium pasteurianum]AJA49480.1 anaerobic dimethyl sulfoxide reductase chain B [Clostridium pasteurianum DSM 525 = ATCC 6013]AJA53468.1 anaerobic dimethyl sulfoxide reductase chain B [Clostridium pasteurianum DSM 525 = ATCC 6013]AOZ76644.1 4Fe-4S ferredoxin [Clostridium pasteurianum DSM 525 = ATCC 6013]AOZ80441.1 4Fe-4S ferredoxin [Clostridium pasteurianum]ELP58405.1 NAD(P)H-dependent nitrate reductase iron-sulfur subunit [Clostridium pa